MKKALLIFFSVFSFALLSNAQIEIYLNGGPTDVSGTTIQISPAGPGTIVSDFHVINNTGISKNWTIQRVRINEQASWSDYLCWGHDTDPFGGTCYAASAMDYTSWTTPASVTVGDGEGGILQSDITPDAMAPATSTYRYYIMDGGTAEDSVDVEVSFSASAPKITPQLSVSVVPNPASESFTVNTSSLDNATVKIMDVLGNVVLKETVLVESKKIDVSNFKNGIYFVIVEAPGAKTVSRKVVVRH